MFGNARYFAAAGGSLLAASLSIVALTHPSNSTAAATPNPDAVAVAGLTADYPALGRIAGPADIVSDRPLHIEQLFQDMPEALLDHARVVNRNDERTLVLVPRTDGVVCLVALFANGGGGSNCNTAGGSPILITYGAAIGTVPASVNEVTYTLDDGSTRTDTPEDGLYYPPANAANVAYGAGDQATTIELMPASSQPAAVKATVASELTPAP